MINEHDLQDQAVLVTGGAGCIGACVVEVLRKMGATPIVYDLADNRERLELISVYAQDVTWEIGDITDYDRLTEVIRKHKIVAIIHLAALQTPFCKADPVGSASVNVVGTSAIFEAARKNNIKRVSYASSIAAPAMADNEWLATLYGAHKVCGEQMAAVYWQDWQLPSVGIRPSIVYGPGRDRGMSAAPTIAMLAAFGGVDYTIPFTGPVSYVHVEDAAIRFIAAVSRPMEGAYVFDLNGTPEDTKDFLKIVREIYPKAKVGLEGDLLPFPPYPEDGKLDQHVNVPPCRTMRTGIHDTFEVYTSAWRRGVLNDDLIQNLIRNYQ